MDGTPRSPPSIASPSLTRVFIGRGGGVITNTVPGSRCTPARRGPRRCRPPSPSSHWETSEAVACDRRVVLKKDLVLRSPRSGWAEATGSSAPQFLTRLSFRDLWPLSPPHLRLMWTRTTAGMEAVPSETETIPPRRDAVGCSLISPTGRRRAVCFAGRARAGGVGEPERRKKGVRLAAGT